MQQTRLDRWLRRHFSMETHIFTYVLPPNIPRRAKIHNIEATARSRYRHKIVVRNPKDIDNLLATIKQENQTFTTQVIARTGFLARLFNHPAGKSFTYRVFWTVILFVSVGSAVWFIPWTRIWSALVDAYVFISQYF